MRVYLAGLATDFCVYFTAMDALERGFEVAVILDACRGIDVPTGSLEDKMSRLQAAGGVIVNAGDLTG